MDTGALFTVDDRHRALLHRAACQLIHRAVSRGGELPSLDLGELGSREVVGVFVTLRDAGQLRGCIGNFTESILLEEALRRAAPGAATGDPRFPPVSMNELAQLTVEISLLHSRRLLGGSATERRLAIEIGRHGLDLVWRGHKGLLLPQVPREWNWDIDQFLDAICRKAQVPSGTWGDPGAELYVFEATYFGGPFALA